MDLALVAVPFGLVLARVGSFVGACPLFMPDNVSMTVRAGVSALLALVLTFSLPHFVMPTHWPQALMVEVLLGFIFAACVRLVAVSIGFAGELLDINLGFGFARIMNPTLSEETTPVMQLAQLLAGLTFMISGGQHHVIVALARSFVLFEPGAGRLELGWVRLLVGQLAEMLQLGLLMALPIVLAMMCVQLGLALLSRLAPQLNIWALGLLGTCGLGLLALWSFMPAWIETMAQLWGSDQAWLFGGSQ